MKILRPTAHEYPDHPYFGKYINTVKGDELLTALSIQSKAMIQIFSQLDTEKQDYCYSEGKWSLKELLGHIIDAERVFSYRVLCIARGEKQSLPGFDENEFMEKAKFSSRSLQSLLREYKALRLANVVLFKSLNITSQKRIGLANGNAVSARALMWMVAGHEQHHLNIINERYL
jgi:uncharacterized damage-inducible protein DinB